MSREIGVGAPAAATEVEAEFGIGIVAVEAPPLDINVDGVINCIRNNNFEAARVLIEDSGVNIDQLGVNGLAPIHYLALCETSNPLFNLIMNNTADTLMTVSNGIAGVAVPEWGEKDLVEDDNILHIAAKSYNNQFSELFCQRFGIYENMPNSEGDTPFSISIYYSNLPMLNFAVANGANVGDQIDEVSSLEFAARYLGEANGGEAAAQIYRVIAANRGVDNNIVENFLAEIAAQDVDPAAEAVDMVPAPVPTNPGLATSGSATRHR